MARHNGTSGRGGLWAALAFILAVSCLYEVFEWLLTIIAAGPMADKYNGQQGDIWDAQKDMAIAGLGGAFGILWLLFLKRAQIRE
jgi:putative membrane protein